MIPWNPCPPLRGIRAHLAVEFVPAIAWNSQVTAVVSHYGAERRSRRELASFMRLREIGFDYPFGPPNKVPQGDEDHLAEFGEDLYQYWYASDLSNNSAALSALLWASIAREMAIMPKQKWLKVYIVDFDRGLVLHAYDDRGMDIVATRSEILEPIYRTFGAWLLDHDRAAMDERFRAAG